ncbi:DEAD/DEAH box helicase [Myxococcus sp. K15C18031901]|uniref:DEAD/DEAH box helicase n=1 Tax=Myxococcus dinghuensis TaxID=2906761 RepID=UPI0020A75E7B|nr:DEAD/DEAH box helicase [Myxococcus dinghuensis]MCP3100436.1 DEAD/DEAH box helicase [Myxococcus dinghuensis]
MSAEPSLPVPPVPSFATEGALRAWLRERGLEHLSRLSLTVLTPRVDPALLPQARPVTARRRLVELLSAEGVERWTQETLPSPRMKDLLPRFAWRFVDEELRGAEQARASLPERLASPEDARTHRVHTLLTELRARIPASVSPRPPAMLVREALQLEPELPGFRFREMRCSELPHGAQMGFILPEASLTFAPHAVQGDCTCGAAPCVHLLAAIDAALQWLRQPWTDAFGDTLEELVRPAWERTLRALERALDEGPGGGAGVEISWRVDVIEGYGVEVFPYVHRRNKKGQLSTGARVSRRKLLQEHGPTLSAQDARLASLLPEGEAPASRALLLELVDHPRLSQEGTPDLRVHVERARVGIVAVERGGAVVVSAGVDGATLPPSMLERVRKAKPEEAHFLWDEGARQLTVLDVGPEVRALVAVLQRHGNTFPPESHGALLEKLSKLAHRLPVAMPRGIMGEQVPAQQLPVLRIEIEPGGAVRVDVRVRALPDSEAFIPGEGARDVYVRRGTDAAHAVRDFVREQAVTQALLEHLPLETAEPLENRPLSYVFRGVQGALALLAACRVLEPRPEVEWLGEALQLSGSRGPGALRVVVERKRDWFGVLGGLAVQGERVALAQLLDAARRKERFVQVKGHTYVEIEEALRHHLERLSDYAHVSRHGLEIGPAAADALAALGDAGADIEADKTWRTLVERIFVAKELNPKVPATLKTPLRDYQAEGFRWLTRLASWGAGGVLADDMGLGKTVQSLAVLLERARLGPALVLAPTSVAFNWVDEAKRFAPSLRMKLFSESEDRGATLEGLGPRDVLVLSYGLLTRDSARLSQLRFATIVFDEAQALKNALTHRFRAARSLQGDFRFALSGTPLENHLGELWSLFTLVFPGLLGSYEAFRTRFALPIERRVDPTAAPALARVLQPFLLRRTKAQVEAQLPPRTDVRVPVVLSSAEWALYEDARLAALASLESKSMARQERDQERRIEILSALTRLRLLASHPRLFDANSRLESSKLERFMELVDELRAEGQRALVFSQFTSHLALVRELLDARGITYQYLDGQTPPAARAEHVRAFQEGTAPLFLISLKAGGFGLNLTAATSVILLDPWWNPAVEDQAADRAHRIGQQRPVTVYRLVARGTIEEQMLALHEDKRALVADVLEGKDQAGRLSNQELLGLLSQRLARPDELDDAPSRTRH